MKQLGRYFGIVSAAIAAVLSIHAMAQTQMAGRDFSHMTTGFPLTGVHAAAACETCHVAGVFKGTARNCDGCHALGRRVVATPKSNNHIVTDAECDTCHFNAATFLGARYNHGNAQPGQCMSCHNGRLSTAKPASHNSGNKATNSCDQCHRSYTWLPASWNHIGVAPGTCANAGCHVQGSNQYFRGSTHTGYQLSDPVCDDCHNMYAWFPAPYKHNSPALCSSCHSGGAIVKPENRKPTTGHSFTTECNACHTTKTWQGASYHSGNVAGVCGTCHNGTNGVKGPSGTHIPLTTGGNPNCDLCHTSTTTFTVYRMNHGGISTCNNCHASTSPYVVATKRVLGNHEGSTTGQDCSNCHTSTSTWSSALGAKPTNHIPYNSGVSCGSCHTGTAKVNKNTLHVFSIASNTCETCHIGSSNPYDMGQETKRSHEGSSANNCTKSGCHFNAASYTNWDE